MGFNSAFKGLTNISVILFSSNSPVNLISLPKVSLSPQSVASKYLFLIVYWSLVPCFSAADTNMEARTAGIVIPVTSFSMAYIGRRTHFPCICMLASSHDKKFFSTSNRGSRDTARAMCYSRSPTHFMNATTQDEVVYISNQKFIQYPIRLIRQRH